MSQLALSLTQAGLASQAETAWEEAQIAIEARDEQDTAYRIYALAQVQAKRYEEAEYTASRYLANTPTGKIAVFGCLASNLVKDRSWEQCKHIIDLIVKEYDLTDVTTSELDDILIHVSIDLACEAQWDQAKELALTIPTKDARCTALMSIVSHLAKAGMSQRDEEAWKEASTICTTQTDTVQASVAAVLVEVLVKVGQVAQAKQIIPTLPDKQTQEYIMERIAVTLARAGQKNVWDEAEKIADEISDIQKRDEVWVAIAKELAQIGQWTQAIAAFNKIQKIQKSDQYRISVLQAWGTLLTEPADLPTREQIAQHLSKSEEKAGLLVSIADTLAQANRYLEQVHLTQQIWLQASTKDDCEYLFAMVRELLLRHPEVSDGFYESFRWVDTFLAE